MPGRLSPAERFRRDIAARGLVLPPALEADLLDYCAHPRSGARGLYARLLRGCRVLDDRGGIDAPDVLWLRWEAMFVAWCVLDEEVRHVAEVGKRRVQRAYARDDRRGAGPTITGIGKPKE